MIDSPQNSLIRDCAKLRTSKGRRASGTFLVEGARELARALSAGFVPERILARDPLSAEAEVIVSSTSAPVQWVSERAFAKLAMRHEGGDGIVAVLPMRHLSPDELSVPQGSALFLVVEGVEKPGNIGALMRSADAAGAAGILFVGATPDLFHPHCIRASLGAVFHVPAASFADTQSLRDFCDTHELQLAAAALTDHAKSMWDAPLSPRMAVALGAEDHGLSSALQERADLCVVIPQCGIGDSLNVSVAGALLAFEHVRRFHISG